MQQPDLILACDLGTSSVKVALVDATGTIRASAREGYPSHFPQPGHAEQHPLDWWRAAVGATRRTLSLVPEAPQRIAAIGVTAQLCGTVPVDAHGEPLHACLIWSDTRSAAVAREITTGGPRIAGYGILRLPGWLNLANGAPNLSGRDPLSKILWFRDALPEVWRRAARFLDVKDWLLQRLTGRAVTTPDVAQLTWLMDNRAGRRGWAKGYLERFGIARERLPEIVEATAVAGHLTPGAAAELGLAAGVPVSGGVGDINANALAAGDYGEGAYHMSIGTGMTLGAHSERRRVNPLTGIATLCAAFPDRYLLVAAQETAGAALCWSARALGFGEGAAGLTALDAEANAARPGVDTPLFVPWLAGERVPVDDSALRGGIAGASLGTTRADLAYAALAGVALNARWAFAQAQRTLACTSPAIALMGGGAESRVWASVIADMLQRPLRLVDSPGYAGARGAAMTAAVVAGWFGTLVDAAPMARLGALVEPDRSRRAWADERYGQLIDHSRSARRSPRRYAGAASSSGG